MPAKNNAGADADSWILIWSDAVIEVFLKLSEEIYNNGKSNDIGFKLEAWVGFQASIQVIYLDNITFRKIRLKPGYICVL